MSISDETIMAYADGELDPSARQQVESAMREDPQIEKRVAQHRALRQRLQAAYSAELTEPAPERLLAAAAGAARPQEGGGISSPRVVRAAIQRRALRRRRPRWRMAAGIAASVILGAGLGFLMWGRGASPLTLNAGGALIARAELAKALSDQLAGEQSRTSVVQIGISFLAKTGDYCRTFALSGAAAASGLACRHGQEWQVELLSQGAGEYADASEYRTAGSAMPAPILKAVEGVIAGEPLDQAGERQARERSWSSLDK